MVGPSKSGKSTLCHMAMKHGLDLISDDITLLREFDDGIEILPFFSMIFLQDEAVTPDRDLFKRGILKRFLFPKQISGSTFVVRIKKKAHVMRKLAPQLLWSLDPDEQGFQKTFLEKLCDYPAFEICWGPELHKKPSLFRKVLDEIIQS